MAKPNYQFDKRQRDLAKKKQQDEKRLKKQQARDEARKSSDVASIVPVADDTNTPSP